MVSVLFAFGFGAPVLNAFTVTVVGNVFGIGGAFASVIVMLKVYAVGVTPGVGVVG
jgi:hypothetical protein